MTVHYPLALLASSTFFDGVEWATSSLSGVAWPCLSLGLATSVLATATGLWDFAKLPERPEVMRTAYRHLVLMLLALASYGSSFGLRLRDDGSASAAALGLSCLGLLGLLAGSYFGGDLVYHHAAGVRGKGLCEQAEPGKIQQSRNV